MVETTRAHAGPSLDAKNESQEKSVSLLLDAPCKIRVVNVLDAINNSQSCKNLSPGIVSALLFGVNAQTLQSSQHRLQIPIYVEILMLSGSFRFGQKTTSISSRGVLRCMHPST